MQSNRSCIKQNKTKQIVEDLVVYYTQQESFSRLRKIASCRLTTIQDDDDEENKKLNK